MTKKKIFSIGFDFPGNAAEGFPLTSKQSLLDADIIIFEPNIDYYPSSRDYKGKPLISENDSYKLKEDAYYWRTELKTAFDSGKTILIFLSEFQEVYIYTSNQEVKRFNNYSILPLDFKQIVPKRGKEIKVIKDLKFLATYWKEFAPYSVYEVYLEGEIPNPMLTTKTGNKVVGAIYSEEKGSFIFLPPIRYDEDSFIIYNEDQDEELWTKEAISFGKRLASCLIEVDKILKTSRESTPPPDWTWQSRYRMEKEASLEKRIKDINGSIEEMQNIRSELLVELEQEGRLRKLLYEKGSPLEEAILEALRLLGFKAEGYSDAESEFDAIFISPEGRFLGEVEGKDNKAIAIEKLSQLERNLHEDFAKEEVSEYAKGVLFGNAFRLQPPSERSDSFTHKCLTSAGRSKVALVCTTDLFNVAKYLKEHKDVSYAKECREAIMRAEGEIVKFPPTSLRLKHKRENKNIPSNSV